MAKIIEGKKIIFPICNTFATVEFLEPFDAWKKIWKGKKNNYDSRHLFIYVTVGLNLTKKCDFGKTTLYLLGWKEKLFFIFIAHYICEHWMYKSAKKMLHTWHFQKKLFIHFILANHSSLMISLMMAILKKQNHTKIFTYPDLWILSKTRANELFTTLKFWWEKWIFVFFTTDERRDMIRIVNFSTQNSLECIFVRKSETYPNFLYILQKKI